MPLRSRFAKLHLHFFARNLHEHSTRHTLQTIYQNISHDTHSKLFTKTFRTTPTPNYLPKHFARHPLQTIYQNISHDTHSLCVPFGPGNMGPEVSIIRRKYAANYNTPFEIPSTSFRINTTSKTPFELLGGRRIISNY
jgi:hypothetical protein